MLGTVPTSQDVTILERKILCKMTILKGTEVLLVLEQSGKGSMSSRFLHWRAHLAELTLPRLGLTKWRSLAAHAHCAGLTVHNFFFACVHFI